MDPYRDICSMQAVCSCGNKIRGETYITVTYRLEWASDIIMHEETHIPIIII